MLTILNMHMFDRVGLYYHHFVLYVYFFATILVSLSFFLFLFSFLMQYSTTSTPDVPYNRNISFFVQKMDLEKNSQKGIIIDLQICFKDNIF